MSGYVDGYGNYHPEIGTRMRHKTTKHLCRLEREAEVNWRLIFVGRLDDGSVIAGRPEDFEILDGEETQECA